MVGLDGEWHTFYDMVEVSNCMMYCQQFSVKGAVVTHCIVKSRVRLMKASGWHIVLITNSSTAPTTLLLASVVSKSVAPCWEKVRVATSERMF